MEPSDVRLSADLKLWMILLKMLHQLPRPQRILGTSWICNNLTLSANYGGGLLYCGSTPVVFGGYDGLVDVRTSTVRGCEMVTSWPPWPANTIAIGSRWATASPEEAGGTTTTTTTRPDERQSSVCRRFGNSRTPELQIAEGRPCIVGLRER